MEKFEKWLVSHKEQVNSAAYGLFEDSLRCMNLQTSWQIRSRSSSLLYQKA